MLLPLLVYVAIATHAIFEPGVYYDEVLQAVPAIVALTGTVNGPVVEVQRSVVTLLGHRIPLLILPYLGSTQTVVLSLAFAAFGIGIGTMRLAFIALGT